MYNTAYNIQTGVNDSIVLDEAKTVGVGFATGTLTAGYYDGDTFATELTRVLNTLSSRTYTVTYNAMTFRLTITNSTLETFRNRSSSTCWKELGLTTSNGLAATNTVEDTVATMPFPVSLNRPLSWYVTIPEFGSTLTVSSMEKYTLFLPMTVGAGGVMEYNRTYIQQEVTVQVPLPSTFTVYWQTSTAGASTSLSLLNSDWELGFSYDE